MMRTAIWTGMYAESPLEEALQILSGHGWTTFEIAYEHLVAIEQATHAASSIDAARTFAETSGLTMPQAHALLQADVATTDAATRRTDIERIERHLEISSSLGVGVVVVHPGGKAAAETRADRDRIRTMNVESFRRLADYASERSVSIGLENLMRRGASTAYEMLDLIDAIDRPNIGITLDTSHANAMDLDIPAMIGELGETIIATHISDNDGSGDQHRIPGDGSIEWRSVVTALRDVACEGLFSLEIPGARHRDNALRDLNSCHACGVAESLVG